MKSDFLFPIIASHLPRNYGLKNQRAKDMDRIKKDDEEVGRKLHSTNTVAHDSIKPRVEFNLAPKVHRALKSASTTFILVSFHPFMSIIETENML